MNLITDWLDRSEYKKRLTNYNIVGTPIIYNEISNSLKLILELGYPLRHSLSRLQRWLFYFVIARVSVLTVNVVCVCVDVLTHVARGSQCVAITSLRRIIDASQ